MYSLDSVKLGIADFLDKEFLPKLNGNTIERAVAGTVMGIMISKADVLFQKAKEIPLINTLGIIDNENCIDLDLVKEKLIENISEDGVGFDIPAIDNNLKPVQKHITLYKNDIENLYECIKRRSNDG